MAVLFRRVSRVRPLVVRPGSGGQAVCSVLSVAPWLGTDPQRQGSEVSPGFHKRLYEFVFPHLPLFVVSLVLCLPGTALFGSPVRNGRFPMLCIFFMVRVSGTKGQGRGGKRDKRVCPVSGSLSRDHGCTCWRGRFPALRVFSPCGPLMPWMWLWPPGDCLVLGVWQQREERKWVRDLYTHSEHTAPWVRTTGLLWELCPSLG